MAQVSKLWPAGQLWPLVFYIFGLRGHIKCVFFIITSTDWQDVYNVVLVTYRQY